MKKSELTQGERHLFEFINGMSGGFFTKLFECMFHADITNQQRLGMTAAFPEEMEAVRRYQTEEGYWYKIEAAYKEGN